MIGKDLEQAVQEVCLHSVCMIRSQCTSEQRKGAEWLLTVGVRYLATQGIKVNPVAYDLYMSVGLDKLEVVLPRRKAYM